jgi:hypothetical protein
MSALPDSIVNLGNIVIPLVILIALCIGGYRPGKGRKKS